MANTNKTQEGETGKLSDIYSKIWSNYEFLETTDLASTEAEYQVIFSLLIDSCPAVILNGFLFVCLFVKYCVQF